MAIDLDRAKAHLRIDWELPAAEEAALAAMLAAAVGSIERSSGRILAERALTQRFDGFTDRYGSQVLVLSVDPVVSVEGIDYRDADGAVLTILPGDGGFRTVAGEPWLLLSPLGGAWPETAGAGAVTVRFTAGYGGAAGPAPAELEAAVLLMLGHLYRNREASVVGAVVSELPLGVAELIAPFAHVGIG